MNCWVLLSLLMAHIVGDFYLQSDKYCKRKKILKIKSSFLYIHSIIIGILSWAFVPFTDFWIYALIIGGTHLLRQFGIRKKSKELQLCRSFSMYWQSLRLVVKETICRECGAEVDEEVVYRAVA